MKKVKVNKSMSLSLFKTPGNGFHARCEILSRVMSEQLIVFYLVKVKKELYILAG